MRKHIFSLATALLLGGSFLKAQDSAALQSSADAAQEKARMAQEKAKLIREKGQADQQKAMFIRDRARALADKLNDEKLNDNDEIIIKRKNADKDEKVTVEIKDDEVFVNGQPIEAFVDDAISVKVRVPRRYNLIAPSSPFRFPGSTWSLENGNMYNGGGMNQPFLGVMTEGASHGTKIVSVTDKSAAAEAGLKKDDIIMKVNDKAVADHNELTKAISDLKPGDKVTITYNRNGKESKTTAVLGKRIMTRSYRGQDNDPSIPEAPEAPEAPDAYAPIPPIPPMEFNFDDLGNNLGKAFSFDGKPRLGIKAQDTEDNKGAKVIGVDEGSAAEKAGLKEDDIITSFDESKVSNADQLAEAAGASKDKSTVKIQVRRGGKTKDIELKVPRKLKTANL